ncbi:MAG: IS1182 family transposase [Bacilli bacterium]
MFFKKSNNNVYKDRNQIEFVCLEQIVPEEHLLRKIENVIDFSFIHKYTKEYYSENKGRPCIDPVILFKIIFLNYFYGKNSVRATIEEIKVNMAYRWFLGLSITDTVPNYSTFSQNYIRRFKNTNVFENIFSTVITKLFEMNLVDTSVIFVDGTHVKASANKHKIIKKQVKVIADKYQKAMEEEINEYRKEMGREFYDDDSDGSGFTVNEETGEIIESNTKTVTVSTTDRDCGMFIKGEHERQLAYVDMCCCDKNGWNLGFHVNPANMHDSKAFLPFFEEVVIKYNPEVICGDAAFATGLIAKTNQKYGIKLLVPYVRPRGKRASFSKSSFEYQPEIDAFLCPNNKLLYRSNIDRKGYFQYRIPKHECKSCPFFKECVKNASSKTIIRHIYSDFLESTKKLRLSDFGKNTYKLRKVSIERMFAEAKEYHGLRYTRYRGLQKNINYRYLLYACYNIKKLALLVDKWKTKRA